MRVICEYKVNKLPLDPVPVAHGLLIYPSETLSSIYFTPNSPASVELNI